jgi:GntR family transcriptional regulator
MGSAPAAPALVADGPVPKHVQLRDILVRLAEECLAPDSPVPSERDLVTTYGVSRATVREAIGQLVQEGRLYRVRGKGTFVAGPRVESTLHLASFTEDMRRRGHEPTTVVLTAELELEPPAPVVAALQLAGEGAYRLERLRLADGVPMAHELGWYTAGPLPDLLAQDLSGSLYELLGQRYGLRIDAATQSVWAETADARLARQLGVTPGAPLLTFRRSSSAGHVPVEHVTSRYRGDRYQVHMSLSPLHGESLAVAGHPTAHPGPGGSA